VIIEERGVQMVSFALQDRHSRRAKMPLVDYLKLLALAESEAELRRRFWKHALIPDERTEV
jgi:hypothetical protein